MTGETQIVATPPPLATPSRDAAPASGVVAARSDAEPSPAVPAPAPASTPPPSFPVTLQFDQDTHRFIIEARDSVSGLVVFQVPFKAAIAATAGSTASTTRGHRVDSEV